MKWLEFESPWSYESGTVRVTAPHEAQRDEIIELARRHELKRPYIFDTLSERRMHFTHDSTQSAMKLEDPYALVARYTRKMMSFLLFNPDPKNILMIGLGGGSLLKFCYRHLEQTRITAVEICQDVIALREEFSIPPDDDRLRVVHDDGARYVERLAEPVDVLLIDAFDEDGIALSLTQSNFYASAARQLADDGILVMNMWGERQRYIDNLRQARAVFGNDMVLVPVMGDANVLLFAFKHPVARSQSLESIAEHLQARLLLDFPRYLRRIFRGHSLST